MIGLVVVSHSRALAKAAVALAAEMVATESLPPIAVAAGLDETTFGTDAMAVSEAISAVDSPDGVLVFLDLGSAVLSAEMALEFLDPEVAQRVRLTSAPLVEGLVAAVVTAATGGTLTEVEAEAQGGLLGKQEHLDEPKTEPIAAPEPAAPTVSTTEPAVAIPETTETVTWTIRNPHGLHARPAAVLVAGLRGLAATMTATNETTGAGPVPLNSLTKVTTLGLQLGHVLSVAFSGPEALAAKAKFLSLATEDFGEAVLPEPTTARTTPPTDVKSGLQIVVGIAEIKVTSVDTSTYQSGDVETEIRRLANAFDEVRTHLEVLAEGEQGAIFAAQGCLLADAEFHDSSMAAVTAGQTAVAAVTETTDRVAGLFEELTDPYLRERAGDVRSIGRMLLCSLLGEPLLVEAANEPSVLVLDDIDAATANSLDPTTCLGIITTAGGSTGHGVIIASSKGIPVLTGRPLAATLADGDLVAFDPMSGELWLRPDEEVVARLQTIAADRAEQESVAAADAEKAAITKSGRRILVEANVASLADAETAKGADGSGLVRTEILFADAKTAPTARQQADAFIKIGKALGGPITIRTWDVGGDKPLPFLPGAKENNPFLGVRGLRMMKQTPQVFTEQLRAVVLAAAEVPVRVMFPMVTTVAELKWALTILAGVEKEAGCRPLPVGIMIEVPAAAVRAEDFLGLVNFVSIGTNDLTQYALAADRTNPEVADLARSDCEAVWDLIALTVKGLPGIPIAVCGDLASRPELVAKLVDLGVTELSVRPPLVPMIKAAVRATN